VQVPDFDIANWLITGCVMLLPMLATNLLVPLLSNSNKIAQLNQEINSLKINEDVFSILLKNSPFYEASPADSMILFGNPDAKLQITILTNPFCNPCARMHKRVEKLLEETENKIGIRYILSSFGTELDFANKGLIAACLGKDMNTWMQIFSDWFEKGKPLRETFFKNLQLNMDNPAIEAEFKKHEAWKEKTKLRATPTILVNGYQLPENYKIEDLRYLTEFNVNVK
jgi:thiol-disulfide isomerase/thioredoxin